MTTRDPAPRDGATITLRCPVTCEGQTISSLTMRPPRVRDILAVDSIVGDAAKEVRLLANLCEVSPRAVEELDLRDYEALQREYSRFQTISAADARRAVLALAARTGWALGEVQEFDVAELTMWLEGLAELTATATAGAPG